MATRCKNYIFKGRHTSMKSPMYVQREKSMLDEFYTEKAISMVNGDDATRYMDPIYILLNQKRLSNIGLDSVKSIVDEMNAALNVSDNPLNELRKQCSDDDLLTTIKSRHIQTQSELLQWSRYMRHNSKEFQNTVQRAIQAHEKESETKVETSNT